MTTKITFHESVGTFNESLEYIIDLYVDYLSENFGKVIHDKENKTIYISKDDSDVSVDILTSKEHAVYIENKDFEELEFDSEYFLNDSLISEDDEKIIIKYL